MKSFLSRGRKKSPTNIPSFERPTVLGDVTRQSSSSLEISRALAFVATVPRPQALRASVAGGSSRSRVVL